MITDEELIESFKKVFYVLPSLFMSDIGIGLTDNEKFLLVQQAKTFKLEIEVGMPLVEGGSSAKAIATKKRQEARYPKEAFGFPIIAYSVPIVNSSTGNAVGTITYAVSLEKEQEVFHISEEIKKFSDQLSESSRLLANSTETILKNSGDLGNIISKTQDGLEKMDDILKYIRTVANTTNLLGLNASIESARAGEYGKGFSVVAGEIRKLAQGSKESADEITDTLVRIKEDINKIFEYVNSFSGASDTYSKQSDEILESSDELNNLSDKLNYLANIVINK